MSKAKQVVSPALAAQFDCAEIMAVYMAIRDVAGRAQAKVALATMDAAEFAEHFDFAAEDGYYAPR